MEQKIEDILRRYDLREWQIEDLKKELLNLHSVSYQRGLLSDCVHFIVDLDQHKFDTYDKQVDEFIKSLNCR